MNNEYIKMVLLLKNKKFRDRYNKFIIEGENFVKDISKEWLVESYIISENYKKDINPYKHNIFIVKDSIFKKLSDTVNSQGIIAICNKKTYDINKVLKSDNVCLLICENIRDPNNLGTMIRTAEGIGCTGIILTNECVDLYNPKVIRGTAGAIFNIPIFEGLSNAEIFALLYNNNLNIIGTHLKGEEYIQNINLNLNCAILVGNESQGLSEEFTRKANILVKIPMIGKIESLNVSVATGIILYEVLRQRLQIKK